MPVDIDIVVPEWARIVAEKIEKHVGMYEDITANEVVVIIENEMKVANANRV